MAQTRSTTKNAAAPAKTMAPVKKTVSVKKLSGPVKKTAVPVRGGWDNLPHNLGQLWTPAKNSTSPTIATTSTQNETAASLDPTPSKAEAMTVSFESKSTTTELKAVKSKSTSTPVEEKSIATKVSITTRQLRPRKAATNKLPGQDTVVELSQELLEQPSKKHSKTEEKQERPKKRQKVEGGPKKKRIARKTPDNPYGLIEGFTPYPKLERPTREECEEVYRILAKIHDDVKPLPPDTILAPSLEVAGCGEVPSVLDGLIRTVLSGATTFDSADRMLQSLVTTFGVLEKGVGKGSIDYNKIKEATHKDVYDALKVGGLATIKAKYIRAILENVYKENMKRREAYLQEKETGIDADVVGASNNTEGQMNLEILKADEEMLSLDHMHGMSKIEAMKHFVRYDGVGIKTAACVTLFSLQKPCFAVDTHVYRMSKWLGWLPEKTNEVNAFFHLEVRCPDNLKYGLHQLFIRHGKTCHKCNDKSYKGTDAWNKAPECPLEHLLNRYTKKEAKPKHMKEKKDNAEVIEEPESEDSNGEVNEPIGTARNEDADDK